MSSFLSESLILDCRQRDARCANALKVDGLHLLRFSEDPTAHDKVTVINECTVCDNWRDCPHRKDVFNSTHNSRRRVHAYLWWKAKLGVEFPIPHELLDGTVWKNLEGCDFGTKRGNGHAKVKGVVCVNPYHYTASNHDVVLRVLLDVLTQMGLSRESAVAEAMNTAQATSNKQAAFETLCAFLRNSMDDPTPFQTPQSPFYSNTPTPTPTTPGTPGPSFFGNNNFPGTGTGGQGFSGAGDNSPFGGSMSGFKFGGDNQDHVVPETDAMNETSESMPWQVLVSDDNWGCRTPDLLFPLSNCCSPMPISPLPFPYKFDFQIGKPEGRFLGPFLQPFDPNSRLLHESA